MYFICKFINRLKLTGWKTYTMQPVSWSEYIRFDGKNNVIADKEGLCVIIKWSVKHSNHTCVWPNSKTLNVEY